MNYIFIEDHVVPQLVTSAIEAYEFKHPGKGSNQLQLETFGLLWGYTIHAKGDQPDKIIATMATVETSATRHSEWVAPNFDSLRMKKMFFETYWPNVELIGTFHSHPYDNLEEIKRCKGWRASEGDETFFPTFHKKITPEQDSLAHIIVTITQLDRAGTAPPERLPTKSEKTKGFVISAEKRKFWLRAYSTFRKSSDDYKFSDEKNFLEIPSLQSRFS